MKVKSKFSDEEFDLEIYSRDDDLFKARSNKLFFEKDGVICCDEIRIPDNLIVCDSCNKEILDQEIKIVLNRAYCEECFNKYYERI